MKYGDKINLSLGVICLFSGSLLNEWILAELFSPDGQILNLFSKIVIRVFDITAIISGLILITYRKSINLGSAFIAFSRHLMVISIIVFIMFLMLEQISRCYIFGSACFNYQKMSTLGNFGVTGLTKLSSHPGIFLEYKPDIDTYNKLAKLKTNSFGLRDKSYELKKPDNVFRAVVLGGSYSSSSGVSNEDSYHSMLEDRLNQESSDISYEFINFSADSYYLDQKIAILKHKAIKYEPDMIMLAIGASTLRVRGEMDGLLMKIRPRKTTFFKSYTAELLKINRRFGINKNKVPVKLRYSEKDYKKFDSLLKELAGIGRTSNIPVCILIIDHDYSHLDINKHTQSVLSGYGFHVINTIDAFKDTNFTDYIIYRIDKHPNTKAHEIFSDVVYKYFKEHFLLEGHEGNSSLN